MENNEELQDTPETCLGLAKPTSPPAGKFNGDWSCTESGWQWYDEVD